MTTALAPARAWAQPDAEEAPKRDCAFGLAAWCLADARRTEGAPSRVRLEAYGGYKFSNMYYRDEIRGCGEAGCTLDFKGAAFGVDAHYNVAGNPRSDDYAAIGLSVSYMPVVSEIGNNASGFRGELGRVAAGEGALGYVPIRISIRRSNFLYLIKSKYLVSAFGAGLAIPVTSGIGDTFTGGDSLKITIGGRLGVELPISDALRVGLVTNWSVVWYGSTFGEAAFSSAYGANLAFLL